MHVQLSGNLQARPKPIAQPVSLPTKPKKLRTNQAPGPLVRRTANYRDHKNPGWSTAGRVGAAAVASRCSCRSSLPHGSIPKESVHCDAHASCRQSPAVAPRQMSVNPGVACKCTRTHSSCHAAVVLPPQQMLAAHYTACDSWAGIWQAGRAAKRTFTCMCIFKHVNMNVCTHLCVRMSVCLSVSAPVRVALFAPLNTSGTGPDRLPTMRKSAPGQHTKEPSCNEGLH
jgi:hypothetical protein